jgi:hypothetical protein
VEEVPGNDALVAFFISAVRLASRGTAPEPTTDYEVVLLEPNNYSVVPAYLFCWSGMIIPW